MKAIAVRIWNAPALALDQVGGRLLDLAFDRRIARVRRLRKAGRDSEADRVLRALQREIEARRQG